MKLSKESKILSVLYLIAAAFWFFFILSTDLRSSDLGLYLQIPLTIIPLVGGSFGLVKAQKWGGLRSVMGRAVTSLSTGMITWSIGMMVWDYYIFFTEFEIPYPSWADVFFLISWPLWSLGVYELSKAVGANYGLRLKSGKLLFLLIPIIVIALSYYLLFVIARGGEVDSSNGWLKLFFDLFYPMGDVVILSVIAVVYSLSRQFLGGAYKPAVLFLFLGFVLNYLTDFTFSYTTTVETYFNGHFVDFMFTTTVFALSFAICNFDPDLRSKT